MSSKIRVLSDATINQIAAGEVIENPSSVVKELIENSIDAGAAKVVIEIEGGGLHLIRITDDGSGMSKDDSLLCLERHATSKIKDSKDLFKIETMGFRGEALASIASISKMTVLSSLGDIGTKIEVEGGKIRRVDPCPRNQGTTIEVRQLFYNVPARRKFQKSPPLCASEITKVVTLLSLAHPSIAFTLYHQERLIFSTSGHKEAPFTELLSHRVEETLGKAFLQKTHLVDEIEGPFHFQGVIGSPDHTRYNRSGQHLFINERPVLSQLASFAIRDAFGTRIASDRHPVYVLHMNIPLDKIDVNVHPQKKEVRLSEEGWIKTSLQKAIERSLQKMGNSPLPTFEKEEIPISFSMNDFAFSSRDKVAFEVKMPSFQIKTETSSTLESKESLVTFPLVPIGLYLHYLMIEAHSIQDRLNWKTLKEEEGFVIVDLQAAKARILFDELLKKDSKKISQALMFPLSFSFSASEMQEIDAQFPSLEEMGFSIRLSGKNSVVIDALPPFIEEKLVKQLLDEIIHSSFDLDEMQNHESLEDQKKRSIALSMSRVAKTQKKTFVLQEALGLVEELLKSSDPYFCPQGNKTIVHIGKNHVDSFFTNKRK